jgi:hypothetical protein
MPDSPWSWNARQHPSITAVLAEQADDGKWCDRLETAATDAVVGKVLCVCAALAVAREVLENHVGAVHPDALAALDLVEQWVGDPTVEQFDRICATIFTGDRLGQADPHGVVWGALRTVTSSVGNYEAAWTLASTADAAIRAGLTPERIKAAARRGVMERMVPTG